MPVYKLDKDDTLVKYFDLAKFLSLLHTKSLYFCRLDKLEDHFEGTSPKMNYAWRKEALEYLKSTGFYNDPPDDAVIERMGGERYDYSKIMKEVFCVNCWNSRSEESAALWKIYSDFGKGILIKSTANKVEESLKGSPEQVRISKIGYLNYEKDLMPDGNIIYPIIHKQNAYSYESEVRLIHEVGSNQQVAYGKYIAVDIDVLIDEIIVGPFSPHWQFELIKDIVSKYCLNKPIHKSKLTTSY